MPFASVRQRRYGFRQQWLEIRHALSGLEIPDGTAEIARCQAPPPPRLPCETPDPQVVIDGHDRKIDAAHHPRQFGRGHSQRRVAVLELLIRDRQFLVRGMQFLPGGLHLFNRDLLNVSDLIREAQQLRRELDVNVATLHSILERSRAIAGNDGWSTR